MKATDSGKVNSVATTSRRVCPSTPRRTPLASPYTPGPPIQGSPLTVVRTLRASSPQACSNSRCTAREKLRTAIRRKKNPRIPMLVLVPEGGANTSLTASAPPPVRSYRSMMRWAVPLPPNLDANAPVMIASGIRAVSPPEARAIARSKPATFWKRLTTRSRNSGRSQNVSVRRTRSRLTSARAGTGPSIRLLARHHRDGLAFAVDVRLAAAVDRDAVDGPACEGPWRGTGVVAGDRVAAVSSDAQPFPTQRELARLGLDPPLADLDVAVEQRQRPDRHSGRVLALLLEGGGEDQVLAGGQLGVRDDLLLEAAYEAVDVVQPVVLDVERVAAEAGAVREQHALSAGLRDVDQRTDCVRAIADVDRLRLRHLGEIGVVDVAVAGWGKRRSRRGEQLQGAAIVERERPVCARLGVPQVDHLLEAVGLGHREVMQLGAVDLDVVELPRVGGEVAPAAERRVRRDSLPALVPDAARAEHREELGLARAGQRRGVEAVAHAHAVERALDMARDRLGRLDSEHVQHRRDEVDRVVVLLARLALCVDPRRPRDDARVRAAAVVLVALPHLERRVERHRPAVGIVVVGLRAAEVVDLGEVLGEVVRDAVGDLVLVDRAVGATLAAGPVVGDDDDHRVLALAGLLEVIQQPADLRVGVGEEPGVDLGHAAEEPLLLGCERVPGLGVVHRRERLTVRTGPGLRRADRVQRRKLGVGRDDAQLLLARER